MGEMTREALRGQIEALKDALIAANAEAEMLRAEVERLQAEIDNRWATGVHTCHENCQRTACVLRRDNERLAEALDAVVTFAVCYQLSEGDQCVVDARALLHPTAAQEGSHE